jgi:hypothetical protein
MLLGPTVGFSSRRGESSMDPQTAPIVRRPDAVLDVLAGMEDRGSPRLPDGENRLTPPTRGGISAGFK